MFRHLLSSTRIFNSLENPQDVLNTTTSSLPAEADKSLTSTKPLPEIAAQPNNHQSPFNWKHFSADFVGGGMSGATTGAIVAIPEYTKVLFQSNPGLKWADLTKPAFLKAEFPNMLKTVPSFSNIFGATCAIEFSVNAHIGKTQGEKAGWLASALSGATFLTAADHFLYRRHKGQNARQVLQAVASNPNKLFTGWTPMVVREGAFIASVVTVGPHIGKQIKAKFGSEQPSKQQDYLCNFLGRLTSGFVTTLASQPFDSMARQMQINYFNHPAQPVGFAQLLKNMKDQHMFYRGATPRLFLATIGGALAGNLYEFYRDRLDNWGPKLFDAPAIKQNSAQLSAGNDVEQRNGPKR